MTPTVIRDGREIPAGTVLETDVCVVGAGAAGITLARELAQAAVRVAVLESGGLTPDWRTQALLRGQNVGLPYAPLDSIRTAAFGGTTDQWGGACRPLDEIDFEARPEIPGSGWPFDRAHLGPYYERAQAVCQLGPPVWEAEAWQDPRTRPALPLRGGRAVTTVFQYSPPTRFGLAYREDLARAGRVTVYLHAVAAELEVADGGDRVTHLRVACLRGSGFRVAARLVVLAAGGIETPRLLLVSNRVHPAGLGNAHDLVGRYFMEHLHLHNGLFQLRDPAVPSAFYRPHLVGPTCIQGALTLSPDTLRCEGLLNYTALLEPHTPARALLGRLRRLLHHLVPDRVWWHVRAARARRRREFRRAPPSPGPGPRTLAVVTRMEQAPNPESRVTLGPEVDALGRRQVRLAWRPSPLDRRTMRRALAILGEEVAAAGLGRWAAALDDGDLTWRVPPHGGHHHMGTTRMHRDPRRGVVDEHGRVHGVSNLYVAGPSVFPTGGHANPVLTIVALALRLADHLRARLG